MAKLNFQTDRGGGSGGQGWSMIHTDMVLGDKTDMVFCDETGIILILTYSLKMGFNISTFIALGTLGRAPLHALILYKNPHGNKISHHPLGVVRSSRSSCISVRESERLALSLLCHMCVRAVYYYIISG